ncbi:agamous-like MADS-box protein AGL66 [Malania oleifera]|uniref:agamous-like MADS-box protein AGL66 n=1 Tax=Malania oleifera TaxID=397392 RepID=UPI0025AEAE64|nr:agamous-like MADS-box protein AGL66 [Malania oleifera]
MGKKVEMKKIEDVTKCQVTYSKRRSSLIKKAHEISVCCAIDVAFLAFSPSGRISKFSNKTRIEDVLDRYIHLPTEKRYPLIKNLEKKQEKLKELEQIKGETSKLYHLNNQLIFSSFPPPSP